MSKPVDITQSVHRSLFTIHRFSFILFFKIEIKVKIIHKLWSCKFFQFPAIFLGRASGSTCPVYESADFAHFKVLQPIEKRVGAKLVSEMMENVTTPDQYELLEMSKISGFVDRARGTGRPTKKDRRELEELWCLLG